jgi:phage-related protein
MTTIGYATLQIIPSLDGVTKSIQSQLGGFSSVGKAVGKSLGNDIASGVDQASAKVEASSAKVTSALKKVEDQTGKVRVAEEQLKALRDKGITDSGRVAAAEEKVAAAKRNLVQAEGAHANATRVSTRAQEELTRAQNEGEQGARRLGRSFEDMSASGKKATSGLKNLAGAAAGIGRGAALGTLGFSAFLGVASGVTGLLAGPMVAALSAVGAAMGVAAAAATGILGPALLTLGLGFKGLQDAAKAYTASDGGVSQAKASAAAAKQLEEAEKAVGRAKRDSRDAEKDLTRARKDAQQQIEDMNLALKGSALTEKDAQLSLLEARRDLQNLGKDGQPFDMIDREQAVLRVQEAEQRLAETQQSNGELADKAAEANRNGVEGSDEVVRAKERVADANQAVAESEERVAEAQKAAADAQSQGQSGVDPFDLMIGQRLGPALDAVKNLQHTITDSLTTALMPAFSTFGGLVDGLSPKLAGLAGVFGTIGNDVVQSLASPANTAAFDKMIAASSTFFSNFLGGQGISSVIGGLIQFAATAADTFKRFGGGINDLLNHFGDWLRGISPDQMLAAFSAVRTIVTNIWNVLKPILSGIREIAGIAAPALAPGFKAIGDAIKQAVPGVMSMVRDLMPALGRVLQNLAPLLPSLVNQFKSWASGLSAVAPHLATLVTRLVSLAPLILGVTLAVKGIGAAMLLWQTGMAAVSIAQGVLAAATGAGTAVLGTNAIAMTAYRVAALAGSAATAIATGAQWLLNAALDANPIGIVVLAIAGLVAGLIYAYNHSETFRKVVQAAWQGIKVVVGAVWDWLSTNVFPALKQQWQLIGQGAMWLWNNAIKPAWEGIKTAFGGAWDFVSGIFDKFKTGWEVLKTGVVGAADAIKNGVKGAFSGLADIIKAPLHALGTFLQAIPTEVFGIAVPGADTLNNWGKTLTGLSGGGYTGSIPIDQVAGVVHGDEHVIKATSRRKIENLYPGLLDFMNNNGQLPMPGYAGGGRVTVSQLSQFASGVEGQPYKWGGIDWGDCSGAVSAIANFATGRPPFSSRFATATEGSELAARGFKPGLGPAGSLNVGWFNGGPYGGHTAATLPDGTNFEMGGRRGNGQFGGGAAGASNPEFTDHAFLPPEVFLAGAVSNGLQLDGGAPTTGTPATADQVANGQFSDPSVAPEPGSGSGGAGPLPTSFSGLATWPLDAMTSSGKADSGPGHRNPMAYFPAAASTAVSGQISSALGVVGINDSPPFLQAASQLISGIKVSNKSDGSTIFDGSNPLSFGQGSGSSALPLAATPTATGTPPPLDDVHGARAGQAPGPGVVYNIQVRDAEDALARVKRKENERTWTKTSHL